MNNKRIDDWFDREIDKTVDQLMQHDRIKALSNEVKAEMRKDLHARAVAAVKQDGITALVAFGKMYD